MILRVSINRSVAQIRRVMLLCRPVLLCAPLLVCGAASPTENPAARQFIELFWALFLLAVFVLVGLVWVGIIRRNVRRQTETVRQREAALEEHYRELFENAHDIIFTHDLQGNLTSLNQAGERILGYSLAEAAGLNFSQLVAADQQEMFREILDQFQSGQADAHCEMELRARNGRPVVLRVNLRLQHLSGRPHRVQGIAWDITERRQAEAALRESDQRLRRSLEERVQLGRDLHDGIIQSIYAIGLGLQECRNLMKEDSIQAESRLARAIVDLNAVIREVRDFIGGLEPETLTGGKFPAALQALAATMSQTQSSRFFIDVDPCVAGGLNSRQAGQLLQIAREAMSNSLRHARARSTVVSLKAQNGLVRLEVRDDGIGFEQPAANGGGHGLRNIAARARELGARNEIISAPGKGTCVQIELPVKQPDEPG